MQLLKQIFTKPTNMKVTIAQLQERIKNLEEQKNSWYQKYQELKDIEDKRNQLKMCRFDEEQKQTNIQVTNLMEVIRWQINPETAKSPFMATKTERDENNRSY